MRCSISRPIHRRRYITNSSRRLFTLLYLYPSSSHFFLLLLRLFLLYFRFPPSPPDALWMESITTTVRCQSPTVGGDPKGLKQNKVIHFAAQGLPRFGSTSANFKKVHGPPLRVDSCNNNNGTTCVRSAIVLTHPLTPSHKKVGYHTHTPRKVGCVTPAINKAHLDKSAAEIRESHATPTVDSRPATPTIPKVTAARETIALCNYTPQVTLCNCVRACVDPVNRHA